MKIHIAQKVFSCVHCNSEIVITKSHYTCPKWRWWKLFDQHARQKNTGGFGVGFYSTVRVAVEEFPDAPPGEGWVDSSTLPINGCEYLTLNSRTGTKAVLLKSRSGGWWLGTSQWNEIVTHWKPISIQ